MAILVNVASEIGKKPPRAGQTALKTESND
jgi:hypothetical protein